jgi:hypothetical protein
MISTFATSATEASTRTRSGSRNANSVWSAPTENTWQLTERVPTHRPTVSVSKVSIVITMLTGFEKCIYIYILSRPSIEFRLVAFTKGLNLKNKHIGIHTFILSFIHQFWFIRSFILSSIYSFIPFILIQFSIHSFIQSCLRLYVAVMCESGKEFSVVLQTCVECPRGTYRTDSQHDFCEQCPEDRITEATGAVTREQCVVNLGKWWEGL